MLLFNLNSIIIAILSGVIVVKTLFDRPQKLENHAACVLTYFRYDADANCLIRQLSWKDWSTQFQIQEALMVYKSSNGLVPESLYFKFVKQKETCYSRMETVLFAQT